MRDKIIDLTQRLVQVNSTEDHSLNAARILQQFLEEYGIATELNEYKDGEANVYCEVGPKNTPKFLISGHLDTVPIGNPKDWSHDPFSGKIIDGELWGRGSVDMKGGTSVLAGVMVALLEKEGDLQQRVAFAATAEEETGLKGAKQFVKDGKISNLSHILIAEPTNLDVRNKEKGIMWFEIEARGLQAHASRVDLGHNAIEGLGQLMPKLQAVIPDHSTPDLGKTSLNFGKIEGGTAFNVVPEYAKLSCDSRSTPGVKNEDVFSAVQDVLDRASADITYTMNIIENTPAILSPDDSFAHLLRSETEKITHNSNDIIGVYYATDGAIFMEAVKNSVPFAIYGPGSTELLHMTNERLEIKQLDIAYQSIYKSIMKTITS